VSVELYRDVWEIVVEISSYRVDIGLHYNLVYLVDCVHLLLLQWKLLTFGVGTGLMFSFFNIDRIFDFFQNIGMHPLVEIGFMPALLASGTQTWSHYDANITPPQNWTVWSDLIKEFATHLIDRYGLEEILQWNFEVWNEPNCCPHNFWTGNQTDYFYLFNVTSLAMKSVHPKLRVGGPATGNTST
jgi:xylan 1,4-beta-xylosidase